MISDPRRRRLATISASALWLFVGGVASAAEVDTASRSDIKDFRDLHDSDLRAARLSVRAASAGLSRDDGATPLTITWTPSAAATLASNAGQTRSDRIEAGYFTPGLAVDFEKGFQNGIKLSGTLTADADFYSQSSDDLNEARLDGDFVLSHKDSPVYLEYQVRSGFSDDYSERGYTIQRYKVGFSQPLDKTTSVRFVGEYRASDQAALRRTLFTATGTKKWPASGSGPAVTLRQALQFSDFRAGSNEGRTDVLSTTAAVLTWQRGGFDLSLNAFIFKNFSNTREKRWIDVEVGPSISRTF